MQMGDFKKIRPTKDPAVREPPKWCSLHGNNELRVQIPALLEHVSGSPVVDGGDIHGQFTELMRRRLPPIVKHFHGHWGPPLWDAIEGEAVTAYSFLLEAGARL